MFHVMQQFCSQPHWSSGRGIASHFRPHQTLGPGTQKSSHLQSKHSFFFSSVLGTQWQTARQQVSSPQRAHLCVPACAETASAEDQVRQVRIKSRFRIVTLVSPLANIGVLGKGARPPLRLDRRFNLVTSLDSVVARESFRGFALSVPAA